MCVYVLLLGSVIQIVSCFMILVTLELLTVLNVSEYYCTTMWLYKPPVGDLKTVVWRSLAYNTMIVLTMVKGWEGNFQLWGFMKRTAVCKTSSPKTPEWTQFLHWLPSRPSVWDKYQAHRWAQHGGNLHSEGDYCRSSSGPTSQKKQI